MPRVARIIGVGLPHHVTQRGNYKQDIFSDNDDRIKYLAWIQEYSREYHLSVLAYCLMQNHVHFVAIPGKEDSLAKTFNTAHMRYSQYFNKRMKSHGHLWQGRFYSCILDEVHLIAAARYIERNPVRAGLVEKPWEWKWSSAAVHVGERVPLIALEDMFKFVGMSSGTWKEYVEHKDEQEQSDALKEHTLTGRPLGKDAFVQGLEKACGKRLHALPVGRPRKTEKTVAVPIL